MAMASARFLSLFPLLLHYRSSSSLHLLRRLNHATFHLNAIFPSHFLPPLRSRSFHPQSSIQSHPLTSEEPREVSWPEWMRLVNWISTSGFCNGGSLDYAHEYVEHDLPLDFLRNANACLDFAHNHPNLLWSLPRGEIEVVIHFCSPFLFKDALGATRRMRSFMGIGLKDVQESDKPSTIDLMRFLLSYAHVAFFSSEDRPMNGKVESSVRKLLGELVNTRGVNKDSDASVPNQFDERHGQVPMSLGKNVQMQRGNWMCPRCNFMNFSKNLKCRDCEEPMPEKHITCREWECPQCNFFNFGSNAVCLRCDSKKAEIKPSVTVQRQQKWISKTSQLEKSADMTNSVEIGKYLDEVLSETSTTDTSSLVKVPGKNKSSSEITENEEPENSERWFRKVSEVYDGDDKDFPETMPMRKGENRFVVSKKKDRSLTSPMYKRRMAMEQNPGNTNNYVPFVPFPPDYFSKPEEKEELDSRASLPDNNNNNNNINNSNSSNNNNGTVSNSGLENKVLERKSLEGSAVKEPDPLDMSEEAKAERWFRRVAQIKNISELSEIPDEDFPSIMPMRKGMNRFVVSKRKTPLERRLTSSQYQRRNIPAVNPDIVKKETDSN